MKSVLQGWVLRSGAGCLSQTSLTAGPVSSGPADHWGLSERSAPARIAQVGPSTCPPPPVGPPVLPYKCLGPAGITLCGRYFTRPPPSGP